ncbi:primase-helicase family protein [Pseudomonas phenolilytica]|uniref:primase-helicase family protein n=1 Tax=Pseudomonas phenolilytica TaxID=2746321 RepID=UPI001F486B9F|nr:DUF5906 domain-containing protein [Pseudomonas phenolilytica]UIP88229.1 hypothetical protein HU825_17425 [Pseudomonas phenolilytica]
MSAGNENAQRVTSTSGVDTAEQLGERTSVDSMAAVQEMSNRPAASTSDTLAVLRHSNLHLAKTWLADGEISAYGDGKQFSLEPVEVGDIFGLSELLQRLERDKHACVIRGRYVGDELAKERTAPEDYRRGKVLRRKTHFDDQPLHSVLIEVDDFEPTTADPILEPALAVEEFIQSSLPDPFLCASYHWQLSNSAGWRKNVGKLKVHIWFWLSEPRTSAELKEWAGAVGLPADTSVFDSIQVHYTSAPVFQVGVSDPVPVRSGFVHGLCSDSVELDIEPAILAAAAERAQRKRRNPLERTGEHDDLAEYLLGKWEVRGETPDGTGLHIRCPFDAEHTSDTGPSSTTYFLKGTGSFERGHFVCKHDHCAGRTDGDFLHAIGYLGDDFDDLPEPSEEEKAEQEAIRQRNAERAERIAEAAVERARFEGGRDALEAERREYQKRENEKIGEGEHKIPVAELVTLEAAINRFVFLADGSRVADVFNPHYDLAFADWAAAHAASVETFPQPDKELANGKTKKMPDKIVAVSELWRASPRRKTAVCRTFKAGGALVLPDPEGRMALNTWRPFDRSLAVDDLQVAGVDLFVEHVNFLFGADADRFLDWLAHIEQRPGELPHTGWLHIAKNFGMGRNWLSSVLARVWAGAVAVNLDLVGMLRTGFNGRLSRKVLAVVDEIREGGRDSQWEHSEKLKSTITEETRVINPKFGRQSVEFNACRWLMFSNHLSAIPLESGDRRVEVVATEAAPRGADYYAKLYAALKSPQFIAAVAAFLGSRDLSRFNPGAHAANTEAKKAATKASQSPMAEACQMLIDHWPADVITAAQLFEVLTGQSDGSVSSAHRRTLEQFGIEALPKPVKVNGKAVRVSAVRNKGRWKAEADPAAIRGELAKVELDPLDMHCARDYLLDLVADKA